MLLVILVSRKYSVSTVPQGNQRTAKREAAVTLSYTRAHPSSWWKEPGLKSICGSSTGPQGRPGLGGGSWQLGTVAILAVSAVKRSLRAEIQLCNYSHYTYYPRSNQLNT